MKKVAVFFILSLPFRISFAQIEIHIVPHFPETAYVVERLIPFSLESTDDVEIESAVVQNDQNCTAIVDRFYKHIFHLYCRESGPTSVKIVFKVGEETSTTETSSLLIFNNRQPEAPSGGTQ